MTQPRSVLDIPIFHKMYDLYKLFHSYHARIPKAERYTLWQKCENTTLSLLEALIETGQRKGEDRLRALHGISSKPKLLLLTLRPSEPKPPTTTIYFVSISFWITEDRNGCSHIPSPSSAFDLETFFLPRNRHEVLFWCALLRS